MPRQPSNCLNNTLTFYVFLVHRSGFSQLRRLRYMATGPKDTRRHFTVRKLRQQLYWALLRRLRVRVRRPARATLSVGKQHRLRVPIVE